MSPAATLYIFGKADSTARGGRERSVLRIAQQHLFVEGMMG